MMVKDDMSVTPPPRQRPLPPPNRRRDKPQLSCNLCRRRKVKCDRQQPCRTCSLRGLAMSCTYPPDATSRPSDRDPHSTVQNRIRELENLVHVLMQRAPKNSLNGTSTTHVDQASADSSAVSALEASSDAAATGESTDCGTLTDTPAGVSYVDGIHWTALLDSISELKDYFQDNLESSLHYPIPPQVVPDYGPSPQLLYGRFAQATKGEILSTIPTRAVADRTISKFFNQVDLAPALLHSGQFIRQYEKFWEDPASTPIIWVGMFFAILGLSNLITLQHGGHDPTAPPQDLEIAVLVRLYREKVVQCLTLGKFTRGGPHVLQTFILYIAIEHLIHEDAEFGTHLLLGMMLNIAMRMGYHRDPKYFPVISAFDGEMRRRTWSAIYQANLIFASQMGLPSMLKDYQSDTEEPRNFLDSDFDENTTELPPSRPHTELTPVLYVIVRSRVAHLWEHVRDVATDTRFHKYEEILAVDQKIRTEKRSIPEALIMKPIEKSIADAPQLIMQRIWLDICFLRLQVVLHKKYFMAPARHKRYTYSRTVCLKTAMKIIEYQHMVYELVTPDGILYEARWKLSSVMNNEFLLATGILCAYMKQIVEIPECAVEGTSPEDVSQLLIRSLGCWERFTSTSRHARRITKVIRLVLNITNTPTESPATTEDDLGPVIDFQDPLLLDLNFPCTLSNFYTNEDSASQANLSSLESMSFSQNPNDDDWINLFQRVSTRVPA
ncbi:hypothetical protein F5Y04DRAFT_246043 [Hypomontagnella monticulosa]|nr:hypothetical protein F5Y04DRAFT_246043 [Hypomontagnella monticulosa]